MAAINSIRVLARNGQTYSVPLTGTLRADVEALTEKINAVESNGNIVGEKPFWYSRMSSSTPWPSENIPFVTVGTAGSDDYSGFDAETNKRWSASWDATGAVTWTEETDTPSLQSEVKDGARVIVSYRLLGIIEQGLPGTLIWVGNPPGATNPGSWSPIPYSGHSPDLVTLDLRATDGAIEIMDGGVNSTTKLHTIIHHAINSDWTNVDNTGLSFRTENNTIISLPGYYEVGDLITDSFNNTFPAQTTSQDVLILGTEGAPDSKNASELENLRLYDGQFQDLPNDTEISSITGTGHYKVALTTAQGPLTPDTYYIVATNGKLIIMNSSLKTWNSDGTNTKPSGIPDYTGKPAAYALMTQPNGADPEWQEIPMDTFPAYPSNTTVKYDLVETAGVKSWGYTLYRLAMWKIDDKNIAAQLDRPLDNISSFVIYDINGGAIFTDYTIDDSQAPLYIITTASNFPSGFGIYVKTEEV